MIRLVTSPHLLCAIFEQRLSQLVAKAGGGGIGYFRAALVMSDCLKLDDVEVALPLWGTS